MMIQGVQFIRAFCGGAVNINFTGLKKCLKFYNLQNDMKKLDSHCLLQ